MPSNGHEAFGESPKEENLNCWQPLKPPKPQREDETSLCVTATKVEKIRRMVHGESLKTLIVNRDKKPEVRTASNFTFFKLMDYTKWAFSSQASNRGRFND
jgi:hypothetical protein